MKDVFFFKKKKFILVHKLFLKKSNNQHSTATHLAMNNSAFVPKVRTELLGINSVKCRSVDIWKKLQKSLPDDIFNLTRPKVKEQITTTLLIKTSQNHYTQLP